MTAAPSPARRYPILIVGGGTAGITVAARLRKALPKEEIAVLEPSEKHYYQPLWTLVGAGVVDRRVSVRAEKDVIPRGVVWIRDAVVAFDPENNLVRTAGGEAIGYDYLVVCPGLQLNWGKVEGLAGQVGQGGVCSNYAFETVESTWEALRHFRGGVAIFTQARPPVKCGGAPQKILYLAADYLRRQGLREKSELLFVSPAAGIFPIPAYARTLNGVLKRYGIQTLFRHELVAVRPQDREARFKNLDTGEEVIRHYDLLHVTPPMSAPDCIQRSTLADASGFVEVDAKTLQHVRYPNVFALGDASSLPTSKTGAAVRKQAPVLVANLKAVKEGRAPTAVYDGYSSCPIVTGYGRLMLAEFDYGMRRKESFPFDQSRERGSMYLLKRYILPLVYWHGMLKGRL